MPSLILSLVTGFVLSTSIVEVDIGAELVLLEVDGSLEAPSRFPDPTNDLNSCFGLFSS